jgi:Flp pilus assembly protein TadD
VADAECADCHPEVAEAFGRTGMGRSLAPIAPGSDPAAGPERFDSPEIVHAPTGLRYRARRDAAGLEWQDERLPGAATVRSVQARWVIGSGNHTRSYLGLVNGRLVQLPLTWYAAAEKWDLSPGYDGPDQPRFERGVEAPCLFCHNDLTPLVPGTADRYEPPLAGGIGCNRCHGDGAAHVAARQAGQVPPAGANDPWIHNPGRASAALQLDLCRTCHLQGDAAVLRPGRTWTQSDPRAPLAEHHVIFAVAGPSSEQFSIASHGQRLAESRCAQASGGRLVCTTCHDPHHPATRTPRAAGCAKCHAPGACTSPAGRAPQADCVPCHMQSGPTSDIPHVRFTDHRIRRRPQPDPGPGAAGGPPAGTTLQALTGPLPANEAPLLEGLAHTHLWERLGRAAHRRPAIEALRRAAPDAEGLAALGRALAAEGDHAGALEAYGRAATLGIREPGFAEDRARSLLAVRQVPAAVDLLRASAPESHPGVARMLAGALLNTGGADAAATLTADVLKRAPDDAALWGLHGAARQRLGDTAGAEAAWQRALAVDPLQPSAAVSLAMLRLPTAPQSAAALLEPLARLPMHTRLNLLLSRAARLAKRPEDALAAVSRARAAGLDEPTLDLEEALALEAAGRRSAARAAAERGLKRAPGHPELTEVAARLQPGPH